MADPDLELKGGGGRGGGGEVVVLFALPAFLFFCDYFFIAQTKGGGPGPHFGFAHVLILVLVLLHLVSCYFNSTLI